MERSRYFPGFFPDDLNALVRYRDYLAAKASGDTEAIRKAAAAMVTAERPQNFDPHDPENIVSTIERTFEETCAALEELGVMAPKQLTEFEFYARLSYYEKKHKNANSKQV